MAASCLLAMKETANVAWTRATGQMQIPPAAGGGARNGHRVFRRSRLATAAERGRSPGRTPRVDAQSHADLERRRCRPAAGPAVARLGHGSTVLMCPSLCV